MKKTLFILMLTPLLLFSCKDAIEELSNIGTFTSTITGDVEKQFDGKAGFVHTITAIAIPKGSTLVIALTLVSNQSEAIGLSLISDSSDGIATGSYVTNTSGATAVFVPVYTVDNVTYSLPDLGKINKITVTSVENLRVKGSFEVNLIEPSTQKAVKIVGTFDCAGITENK